MTKEEIAKSIHSLEETSSGKRIYPGELKKAVIDSIPTFRTMNDAGGYYGISPTLLSAWKYQQKGRVEVRSVKHGKMGVRYSISTKIQVCKQILEEGKTLTAVALKMEISHSSVAKWLKDYQDGLFNLEHCTQISRKKFRCYDLIISELKDAEAAIADLKREAKESLDKEYEDKLKEIA